MSESLFMRLFRYGETPDLKPEENYLTEMLAWMVDTLPKFGHDYVDFLCNHCKVSISVNSNVKYDVKSQTQLSVEKGFIDMLITAGNIGFICEHKIDSELSDGQLLKYRDCKNEIDKSIDFKIVLITKRKTQHKQNPDIAVTWYDIYEYFDKAIHSDNYDIKEQILIEQFLMYLTEVGMGKKENINIESIKRYGEAEKLENALKCIFNDLKNEQDWKSIGLHNVVSDYNPNVQNMRWGRIGIDFSNSKPDKWKPNIFVGVVLSNFDHKLRYFDSPQLVILIDCNPKASDETKKWKWLQDIYAYDRNEIEGFKIDKNANNKWRLLILQKPLTDVLKKEQYEEQKEEIKKEFLKGIKWIMKYYNND